MFTPIFSPYLTPLSSVVLAQPWQLLSGEKYGDLPPFLSSWSQGTSLELTRTIEVNRAKLLEATQLPEDAELAVTVSWVSDATNIRRRVYRAAIGSQPVNIQIRLAGDEISGRISIHTNIILNNYLRGAPPWVAQDAGAIFLKEVCSTSLEGDGAVFPMSVIDFTRTRYPNSSSWYLEATTDLESRFSSSFQVLINENDKRLVKAIESANPTREQSALLNDLTGGIIASVLQLAYGLRSQGVLDLDGHEEGTVGEALAGFIKKTGDEAIEVSDDPLQMIRQRSMFESLARDIGAGRRFE